jgi:hypothetical protein
LVSVYRVSYDARPRPCPVIKKISFSQIFLGFWDMILFDKAVMVKCIAFTAFSQNTRRFKNSITYDVSFVSTKIKKNSDLETLAHLLTYSSITLFQTHLKLDQVHQQMFFVVFPFDLCLFLIFSDRYDNRLLIPAYDYGPENQQVESNVDPICEKI